MKVVHIGDSDGGGGAANAMMRLDASLKRLRVQSQTLVRTANSRRRQETITTRGDRDDLFPRVKESLVRQYVDLNRAGGTNTHFSLYVDGADASALRAVASADVVNLHWTAPFQTPADVRRLFERKPVVWTLHDLAPLTGGCHFPNGCERFTNDCRDCPQLESDPFEITAATMRDKKNFWANSRMSFVAPSRYIAELALRSAIVRDAGASVVHIPHGLDTNAFRPSSKVAARRALGIPLDGRFVLCGSYHNSEMRKGLHLLHGILAGDGSGVLTVGEPKLELGFTSGAHVVQLGHVPAEKMSLVYAAADIFVLPSLEDNFPCMLLESLSCGTPAVAFDVGGVGEILRDGVGGRLIRAGDQKAMAAAIGDILGDSNVLRRIGESARAFVEENFDDGIAARRYRDHYEDVLSRYTSCVERPLREESEMEAIFPRWSMTCLVDDVAWAHGQMARRTQEASELARSLVDQNAQVHEKEAERIALHSEIIKREALIEVLERTTLEQRNEVEMVHAEIAKRDEARKKIDATALEQRKEIEMFRAEIAKRDTMLRNLDKMAIDQRGEIEMVHAEIAKRDEARKKIDATVLEQRKEIEMFRAEIAKRDTMLRNLDNMAIDQRREIEMVHAEIAKRDRLLKNLESTALKQREEIDMVHRVAEERQALVEALHRSGGDKTVAPEVDARRDGERKRFWDAIEKARKG